MDFEAALAYLDEHASYDKTGRVDSPTVEPISRLSAAMADPHLAQPAIHVTGTNGKGSTVQMISRLLMAQGLTVGTYTSPHLERITERIKRNGEPICDEEFAEAIAGVADVEAITGVRPTYFEAVTAAGFRWFAAVAVDVAKEKAGIIKPGSAAVIGETDPELVQIFRNEGGATTLVRGDDFDTVDNSLAIGGRTLDLRTPTTIYSDVFLPLHGAYQGDNASVALAAVETFFAAPLAADVVHEGFANVEMPGRFEVLGVQPLTIIDGAHNPPGADVCASVFFDDFEPQGRRILVVGTLREPGEMLAALRADEFDVVHACTAPSPRGVPGALVAKAARALGCDEVYVHDDVPSACAAALRYADADDAIIACGSIYVAGAARQPLRHLSG